MAQQVKYKLVWTEPATCDLEKIDRYLRRRNPAAAEKLGEGLLRRVRALEKHPELGRSYEEEPSYRLLPHRDYKIFYRVKRRIALWKSPMSGTVRATIQRWMIC